MKDPSKVLGEGISWNDDSRDVLKFHFSTSDPFLDGIVLDINMPCSLCDLVGIRDEDGSHIIFIDHGGSRLRDSKSIQDSRKMFDSLGSRYSSNELCFC